MSPSVHRLKYVAFIIAFIQGCGGPPPGGVDLGQPPGVTPTAPTPLRSGTQIGRLFVNTTDGAHMLLTENGVLRDLTAKTGRIVRCLFFETGNSQAHCLPSDGLLATFLHYSDASCQQGVLDTVRASCGPEPSFGFVNSGTPCAPKYQAYALQPTSPASLFTKDTAGACRPMGPPTPGITYYAAQPVSLDSFPHGPIVFE